VLEKRGRLRADLDGLFPSQIDLIVLRRSAHHPRTANAEYFTSV